MATFGISELITAEQYAKSRGVTLKMVLKALRKGDVSSKVVFEGNNEVQMLQDPISQTSFELIPPTCGVDNNWHVVDVGGHMVAHCYGFGHDVADGEPFARRIEACLNFCKGLDNELLESFNRQNK